jgi:RimJ/RimL family protein N-acetyltransferase
VSGIRIRPYRLDDAPVVWEAVRESLRELQPWLAWCHPGYAIEETRVWLAEQVPAFQQATSFAFAITTEGGAFLGGTGLDRIDRANRLSNVGYWVRSSAARRGVATAAVGLIREWAFTNTDLVRLEILVATGNIASRRVAEKSGAVYEGTLRSRIVIGGTHHDAALYAFVRSA